MHSDISSSGGATTTSANRFYAIQSNGQTAVTAVTGVAGQNVMPYAGVLSNLYVKYDTTAGGGFSRTFAVYINGVQQSLAVTIADGATSGSNTSNTATFAVGDSVSIITNATGTTANTGNIRWTLKSTSGTAAAPIPNKTSVLSTSSANMSGSVPTYLGLQGVNSDTTSSQNVGGVMPASGTFKNAYAILSASPGASPRSYTLTLVKNDVDTGIVVTVGSGVTTGNDTTHTASVTAGDTFYWRSNPSATAPTARAVYISMEFTTAVNGESVQMYGSNVAPSATAPRFQNVSGSSSTFSATESSQESLTQAATWRNFYQVFGSAPGAGAYIWSWFVLNGSYGNPTVIIADSATNGSNTVDQTNSNAGDTVSWVTLPTNPPQPALPTSIQTGFVTYMTPSALAVGVSESVTVSEFERGNPAGPGTALAINKFESIAVSESKIVSAQSPTTATINTSSSVTVTEDVTIDTGDKLYITVAESITVTDLPNYYSDLIIVYERVLVSLANNVRVSDNVALSELIVMLMANLVTAVSDNVTVTDMVISIGATALSQFIQQVIIM